MQRHYRVVVAGLGLDDDGRGTSALARALRDSGFEVVDTGPRQSPAQVAATVLQEDADAVGVHVGDGDDREVVESLRHELAGRELADVVVFDGPADTAWLTAALDAREVAAGE